MSDYIISCCSTADLTKEQFEERDLKYLLFNFELDGKQYKDDLGVSIPFPEFYGMMKEGLMTRTSQPNASDYDEYFRPYLEQGKDIIHLVLSGGISGAINSAKISESNMREEFPDRKIYVFDSLAACGGFGLLMNKMADLRDAGMGIDELAEWVEEHKLEANHWFFPTDLTYLVRGGRVSKASGFVGNMLNICPLLNVDFEGRLIPRAKIRTKKKVIQATADKMLELANNGADYDEECIINHSSCLEDAKALEAAVVERMPKLAGKIKINYIGTTIGSHTGPGTVALFFWGKKRVD